tara:strand:- start:34178 stop:34300 length:123 start_codon:yes stop_codon:yes gene_type:complete
MPDKNGILSENSSDPKDNYARAGIISLLTGQQNPTGGAVL